MLLPILAIIAGLAVLVWSADKFVAGASGVARHFGMPPLLIGMVIVGFGTSAPELAVSALSALQNNPGIALGNAYGSNIANIALILGVTALISPIAAHSGILRKELPILAAVTGLAVLLVWDLDITTLDAWIMLGAFALLMAWSIYQGLQKHPDALADEFAEELAQAPQTLGASFLWLGLGLALLILSSRYMVWGSVEIATALGVSDLVIGLTIVAIGTSLPELASSIAAARKGEHDIALGNIIGSNLFNTLAVVGLATAISPIRDIAPEVLTRDLAVNSALTLALFAVCYRRGGHGAITRLEGGLLLTSFVAYNLLVFFTAK